jgi:hypothetical protein
LKYLLFEYTFKNRAEVFLSFSKKVRNIKGYDGWTEHRLYFGLLECYYTFKFYIRNDKIVYLDGEIAYRIDYKHVYRVCPNSTDKFSGQILRSKISIKLLIHMGSKTLSLRDNQQKRKNNYDLNSLDFMGLSVHWTWGRNFDNFCKLYIAPFYFCTFHQKIPPDSFCCW